MSSKELNATWDLSREALAKVMEVKNSGKGAKRENFTNVRRKKEKT